MPGTGEALRRRAPWSVKTPLPRAWPPGSEASPVVGLLATETLQEYLKVVMALTYEEKPPYATLRSRLGAVLQDLRVSTYDPVDLQRVP